MRCWSSRPRTTSGGARRSDHRGAVRALGAPATLPAGPAPHRRGTPGPAGAPADPVRDRTRPRGRGPHAHRCGRSRRGRFAAAARVRCGRTSRRTWDGWWRRERRREFRSGCARSSRSSSRRASSIPPRSTRSSSTYETSRARATARGWSPGPGPIRPTASGCAPTPPPPSPSWATAAARASTWWRWRTRPTSTTSSSARCAPATRGRCSACRPSGTSRRAYRSRAVIDPRGVLREFGVDAARRARGSGSGTRPPRCATSSSRCGPRARRASTRRRWPRSSPATAMIGTALAVNGAADMGGMMGFGPVVAGAGRAERFHAEWERRVLALVLAMGAAGRWNIDAGRYARESLPPAGVPHVDLLRDLARWAWSGCWSRRPRRARTSSPSGRAREPGADVHAGRRTTPRRRSRRAARTRDPRRAAGPVRRRATRSAPATLNPPATPGCPRYARGQVGDVERRARRARVPGQQRPRQGRGPAVALHRALQRRGAVGRCRRPDVDRRHRRLADLPRRPLKIGRA